jgi:hypothetical protein
MLIVPSLFRSALGFLLSYTVGARALMYSLANYKLRINLLSILLYYMRRLKSFSIVGEGNDNVVQVYLVIAVNVIVCLVFWFSFL